MAGRPKQRAMSQSTFNAANKIGLNNLTPGQMASLAKNYYQRRELLRVPDDIQAAHPDKQFCYLNYAKLEQNSFWNQDGWNVFKKGAGDQDSENMDKENFGSETLNGYVRRNEMVLAWMPKDQYEMQQLERLAAREQEKLENVILSKGDLAQFQPHVKITRELDDLKQR
jgi:hypothetical protein